MRLPEFQSPDHPFVRLRSTMTFVAAICLAMASLTMAAEPSRVPSTASGELTLVVMDPLAAPLACDCVKGYANRQYQRLGEYLESRLNKRVHVLWSESLAALVEKDPNLKCDVVIGKNSVVVAHGKKLGVRFRAVASLTDMDGSTIQRGLFVVRSSSAVASMLDLEGYTVFFGPEECDEKWQAPRKLLKELDVHFADSSRSFDACSEAAKALMEATQGAKITAVISSYAAPLLEGCGTIRKSDLRVVGQTGELPFITAFVNESLPADEQTAIEKSLVELSDPELLTVLESAKGFKKVDATVR